MITSKAGKAAVKEISYCLSNNLTFTQETTLAGHRIEKTIRQARKQGYAIAMFYVGLNSVEESIWRIANRGRKGGHDIPEDYVRLRYRNRLEALKKTLPLCDEVVFYDNENGFVKVAEIKNNTFNYTNGYRPDWIKEVEQKKNDTQKEHRWKTFPVTSPSAFLYYLMVYHIFKNAHDRLNLTCT